jgi:hypothetical protein
MARCLPDKASCQHQQLLLWQLQTQPTAHRHLSDHWQLNLWPWAKLLLLLAAGSSCWSYQTAAVAAPNLLPRCTNPQLQHHCHLLLLVLAGGPT